MPGYKNQKQHSYLIISDMQCRQKQGGDHKERHGRTDTRLTEFQGVTSVESFEFVTLETLFAPHESVKRIARRG